MTRTDIGNVNCCWGNPDEIYFTVEGSDKVYNVDLRDEWYAFPIGIWDGYLIIGNEDSYTNGMMHDEVLDYYVYNEGWPPLDIAPAKEKYDKDDYADEQVIYNDIDDYPEYYYEPVELDDDGYWYDEDGNQYEEEDYEYRKLKPEYQMTYGDLFERLGSPEARGRFFEGHVPLEGYNEAYFDFVSFWDDPDKDDAKSIMREIGNPYYVIFSDEKEAREYYKTHEVQTLKDYIDGNIGVEVKKDEEAFALHLMKPEDKWKNTADYRRNRDEVINIPKEKAAGTVARYNALKNMYGENRSIKRINILESQMMLINEVENVAGTDEPYYKDPDTGFVISGENGDPDACPFGYFQYKYGSNDLKLFTCWDCEDAIDSDSLLHGDIAREVTYIIVHDLMYRIIIPHEEEILRSLYDLINKGFVNEHNFCDMVRKAFSDAGVDYEPNDDFISFLKEDIKGYEWSELLEYGGLFEDVYSHIGDAYCDYDDYYAYGSVFGVDTNEIIHNSRLLGRVWVDKSLITFYPGQQPSRDEMKCLLKDLSKNIRVEYDKFLDFYIIFETGGRNGYKGNGYHGDPTAEIKCCKVSEYIEGKYNGFNRDEEIEMVKNRKGVEKLNIHLAKPEDKREFFKDFRKTRDEALYAPMEKAAGTIARYNALKNMYGENRNLKRINILESQRIIHLAENTFHRLFLTEGISDVTYHYCCLEALYGMLKDGKIKLSMESNKSDAYHRTKTFYLSTQRSKSLKFGYARNSKNNCRIELDGYQLKADGYEGMPLDYWGGSMGKQSDIGLNAPRVGVQYGEFFKPDSEEKRQKVMDMQAPCTNFEFEDRIFSDVPSLPLKYIKRVDCLINKIVPFEKAILSLASNLGINVFFYDNERDFTLQTSNIINRKIIMSDGEFEEEQDDTTEERKDRGLIRIIVDLLGLLFYKEPLYRDGDYERLESKTMEVLNKFGLEKFYEKVADKVPENIRWANEHCFTMADQLRKLNTKSKSKFSENVMLLGQYVLRTHGVNNFNTLRTVIEKERYGKKEEPPRNVVETAKCVISSYQDNWEDNYSVLDGEKRLFWDFIYKDQFYDDIKRQLDDDEWNQQFGETPVITHKSKNNESFMRYIQHIMRNDNLSLYDGATILYKIFGGSIQGMCEMFGRVLIPIDIDKESFMKHLDNFSSSDRNDIEERLFKDWQEYGEYYNKFKQQ